MAQVKRFYYNIDLVKNALLNAKLNPLTTVERNLLVLDTNDEGYITWDKTEDAIYVWDGNQWVTEKDPTVPSWVKAITSTEISTWNLATPQSRKITINGDQKDLSVDRSWTINVPTATFTNNVIVSLSPGKTVGPYTNGDTIPTQGKTFEQAYELLTKEPIAPSLVLSSPTIIQFNQTIINNVLNFTKVINSLGATVTIASLQWRRNNTGSWITLSNSTSAITFTHSLTDSSFNSQPFTYQYTVVDSLGATSVVAMSITPTAYVSPTINFNIVATSLISPEVNNKRERGNISSTLSGYTNRNSPLVNITGYSFEVSINGGSYINLSSNSLSGVGSTFTSFNSIAGDSSTISLVYRVGVTDIYTTTYSNYTVNFTRLVFYGPVDSSFVLNSTTIRSLSRKFVDSSNIFTFLTGSIERRFIVSMDTSRTLFTAIDIDNNVTLTSVFINNIFNVNDFNGIGISYNNYVYTNAIPYNPSITLQITY